MWSVFFVFLSYLDRNVVRGALDTEKESKEMLSMLDGSLCAKMSMVGENFLYQVSDGAEVVRSLVSPAGKLVTCSLSVNQLLVRSFMQECRLGLKEKRAVEELQDAPFTHMDEAQLMCREFLKISQEEKKDDNEEFEAQRNILKRSKRGFTYPGTLWCGAGNMADHYDQLGQFAETDSCCRIHDHCPHVIHAFSSNYGYTNYKWHSICHCDCDNALKACLRRVNDTSSRVVGQAFFNVIGVPCFDFTYEDQCAERHWYGVCKEYKKFPIAVLRNAVPYDFGGIPVIDQLTMAPPTSKKNNKEEKPESPTLTSMSSPEEPSLRNVVTAAEDFIKVLATVSTSQSSNSESDKGEAQNSEKKKKKNMNKKKKKKTTKKSKGKGRKRKLEVKVGIKPEKGAEVSPSGNRAEDEKPLNNFISESEGQLSRNTNRVSDRENELERKDDEPFNEVMKDEPVMDEKSESITPPSTVQKNTAEVEPEDLMEEINHQIKTTVKHKVKTRRQSKERRKKGKKTPSPSPPEEQNTINHPRVGAFLPNVTITPTAWADLQNFTETVGPIIVQKVKRNRSKERGTIEERKKRVKTTSPFPVVTVVNQNSSVDSLDVISLSGTPTVPSIPITEKQPTLRPEVHRLNLQVTTLNASFSVLKKQKSKEKGLRKRWRKLLHPSPSEKTFLPHDGSENVLPTPNINTAQTETNSEQRLLTTVTPIIRTKPLWKTTRQQTNPTNKAAAALSDTPSVPKQTKPLAYTAMPFNIATAEEIWSDTPRTTTSAVPALSPRQRSIERVKAQFSQKKKRKAMKRAL